MRTTCRGVAVFLLALGLVLGTEYAFNLQGSVGAEPQKDKGDDKDKKGDDKVKEKSKDKNDDPYQHLYGTLSQLVKAREALRDAIEMEAKQKRIEKDVIDELRAAIKDINQGINRVEKAIKKDKK